MDLDSPSSVSTSEDLDVRADPVAASDEKPYVVAAVVSILFLALWTAALIFLMFRVYQPTNGMWILVMIGIAAISVIPVLCVTVLMTGYMVSRRIQAFRLAASACLFCIVASPVVVAWLLGHPFRPNRPVLSLPS